MNYKIYLDRHLYSEFEETALGYKRAEVVFKRLKRRHRKDGKRVTLCGIFGEIIEDFNKP